MNGMHALILMAVLGYDRFAQMTKIVSGITIDDTDMNVLRLSRQKSRE